MIKAKFYKPDEIAAMFKDGMTVCPIGMTLVSASESILKALEKSFLETGHPRDMTLLHSCGQSDRKDGIQHFAHEGMIKRIVGSHWGLQPRWMESMITAAIILYLLGTAAALDGDDCQLTSGSLLPAARTDCTALSQHGLRLAGQAVESRPRHLCRSTLRRRQDE